MVHGGPRAGAWPELAGQCHVAPKRRGGSCGPYRGVWWLGRQQGRAGDRKEQTTTVKLGTRLTWVRRSETRGGIGCGGGRGCS
jgi:hypothetical protein